MAASIYYSAQQLLIYNKVLGNAVGQNYIALLGFLEAPEPDLKSISLAYSTFFRQMVEVAEFYEGEQVGDGWQNYLLDLILDDENPYSLKAVRSGFRNTSKTLINAARHDLEILQKILNFNGQAIAKRTRAILNSPDLTALEGFNINTRMVTTQRNYLKFNMLKSTDLASFAEKLADYYLADGVGDFGRFRAFRWVKTEINGTFRYFEAVKDIDEQHLENLIGYEDVRAPLIQNTEQFLKGLPANNVLLYGARGTGKSSTIKALLQRYGDSGLRLVEVHKNYLSDYPLIIESLRERPEKFVLFVDDLSFEADEFNYKDLKALLEGSLEARPKNVLIYATSNRHHLIRENFGDSPRPSDAEVSAWDTVEEKLSLSDRFGLILTFVTPNQRQYLEIVNGLSRLAGITESMGAEELRRRALQWEVSHSGRSGRLARQFVDHLKGELSLKKI